MPTRKPHQQRKRPRVAARGRRRPGAYADAPVWGYGAGVRPEHTAEAYRWRCPQCPCVANLRGLLRDECSRCGHLHQPPAEKETP